MFRVPITLFSWIEDGVATVDAAGRVDDHPGIDHGVDVGRAHDLLDQRMLDPDLDVLRPLELAGRLLRIDPDDRLDRGVGFESPGQTSTPVGGKPGQQDPRAPVLSVSGMAALWQ